MDTDVGTAISTGGFVNPYSETATNVFDAANRLTSTTNGNASVSTFGYDSANRTTSVVHKTSGSTTLASYQYSYDNASNVSTRTDSDGTVTTFGYDTSDQLTSEVRDNSHGTGYSIALAYDHNGNRTSKVQGGVTTTSVYDHHDKLTSAGSKSYGYDSNGNCTTVTVGTSVTTLTYDIENRVVGISYPGGASNSFAYNGEDLRTKKVDSTGTQNYVTDGDSPGSALLKDGNAVYTPGLSEHRGSASKFYHSDALGSTRGITDSTQAVTDSVLYDAFGNTVTRTGTTPTPFGFVGKAQYQSDSDSGLQLLGHRYYDPSIGRFLSSDPAKAATNWYVYCNNNPLKSIDPDGLDKVDPILKKKVPFPGLKPIKFKVGTEIKIGGDKIIKIDIGVSLETEIEVDLQEYWNSITDPKRRHRIVDGGLPALVGDWAVHTFPQPKPVPIPPQRDWWEYLAQGMSYGLPHY